MSDDRQISIISRRIRQDPERWRVEAAVDGIFHYQGNEDIQIILHKIPSHMKALYIAYPMEPTSWTFFSGTIRFSFNKSEMSSIIRQLDALGTTCGYRHFKVLPEFNFPIRKQSKYYIPPL